eukprot:Opistho-2@46575
MTSRRWYFDLLYSNSMWRQSSMPTSILIELFMSGRSCSWCTHRSSSFTTSDRRRTIVTRTKYRSLTLMPLYDPCCFSTFVNSNGYVTFPGEIPRGRQFLYKRHKLVVVAPVVKQLYLTNKFNLDSVVFELLSLLLQIYVHLSCDCLAIEEEKKFILVALLTLDLHLLTRLFIVQLNLNLGRLAETEKIHFPEICCPFVECNINKCLRCGSKEPPL